MAIYFDKPGRENTEAAAKAAVARAKELGIREFVVASNKGPSAWALINELGGDGTGVTVVTHVAGFKEPFKMEMGPEERKRIIDSGAAVVTAAHALSGIERSFSGKYQGGYPALIVADVLRMFGAGTKVAVECAIMAADAGTLSGGKIVSVGGTGGGADTAIVMTPGHSSKAMEQIKIHEIICKPGLY